MVKEAARRLLGRGPVAEPSEVQPHLYEEDVDEGHPDGGGGFQESEAIFATVLKSADVEDEVPRAGARFVVAVTNNQVSLKAFFDALMLSSAGDKIEVVHCTPKKASAKDQTVANMMERKYKYIFKSSTLEPKLQGRQCSFKRLEIKRNVEEAR